MAIIQRINVRIINKNFLRPYFSNIGSLFLDFSPKMRRMILNGRIKNTPIKKGYNPGPGRLNAPKPYLHETIMITIPKTINKKVKNDSGCNNFNIFFIANCPLAI
jgi:hypothetical protein